MEAEHLFPCTGCILVIKINYLLADSCMIHGLHPKKKSSLKATMNVIPSWVEAILSGIDNALS